MDAAPSPAALGNRLVIIILETDSLALQTCLNQRPGRPQPGASAPPCRPSSRPTPTPRSISTAATPTWNSAADQAEPPAGRRSPVRRRLLHQRVQLQLHRERDELRPAIISALNGAGVTGKRQIIDTSRNGGASGDWCADDNTDRRIGQWPTLNTGSANVDGLLWVKPPGEADGCAFTAGSFQPTLANSLIQGVGNPPSSSSTSTSRPPTSTTSRPATHNHHAPSRPPTTTTTSRPPTTTTRPPTGGACSATYQVINSWNGGYQVTLTMTAGSSAINGWTLTWTQPSGNTITQLWNGTMTTSGSTVTVRSLSWNGSLGAGASTQIGFLGTGSTTVPAVTCTSP